ASSGSCPESFYNVMYSTARGNVIHYSNPTVDAALTQLRGETDVKKQNELYTTISKNYLDDAAGVFWYRTYLPTFIRKGVNGMGNWIGTVPDYATAWIA